MVVVITNYESPHSEALSFWPLSACVVVLVCLCCTCLVLLFVYLFCHVTCMLGEVFKTKYPICVVIVICVCCIERFCSVTQIIVKLRRCATKGIKLHKHLRPALLWLVGGMLVGVSFVSFVCLMPDLAELDYVVVRPWCHSCVVFVMSGPHELYRRSCTQKSIPEPCKEGKLHC